MWIWGLIIGKKISSFCHITDLQFVCQITQYWLIGKDVYKGRPNTERWVAACREYLAPYFDIVYKPVYDIAKAGTMTAELDL